MCAFQTWTTHQRCAARFCMLLSMLRCMQLGSSLHGMHPLRLQQAADETVGSAQLVGPVQVARRSDMDMNGHINNVTYLAWALETVPSDVYLNFSLQQVGVHSHFICFHGTVCLSCACCMRWQRVECMQATRAVTLVHARVQVEIDYKSECMAGQTVESLGSRVVEDTNGTGLLRCAAGLCLWQCGCLAHALGLAFAVGAVCCGLAWAVWCLMALACTRYVHLLRRCDDSGCHELVRARTTWRPTYPKM